MRQRSEQSAHSWGMGFIKLVSLCILAIGLVGIQPGAAVSAAGNYIDPVTMPRITGILPEVTQIAGLSNDKIALLSGAYNNNNPSVKVINTDGSLVFNKDLTAALGSRAVNKEYIGIYPIASGSMIVVVEGTTNGCDNNTNNLFRFLRLDASGNVTTNLTDISAATRNYNCYTSMAELSNGNLAFTYQITGDAYALRIFKPDGTPVTAETSIQKTGTGNGACANSSAYSGTIAANRNGTFLVVEYCYDESNLYGKLYNNDGSMITVGGAQHFVLGQFVNYSPYQSVMALSDNNYMVAFNNGSGYVFKKVTPAGVVSDAGTYSNPNSGGYPNFRVLPDGGFAVIDSRMTTSGGIDTYYDQGATYSNTGAVVQAITDLDPVYADKCASDWSNCDSWNDPNYAWVSTSTGYNRGILYLNGRTHDLVMHSFLAAALPTVTTNTAGSVTTTSAALNGTVNANNSSTTVSFEFGLTTAYGTSATAAQSPVSGTSDTQVSAVLSGLTPNSTYHFRVVATNAGGTSRGVDQTFTTTAAVPNVTTGTATTITTTSATMNGTVSANNASSTVTFEYGLTNAYGSTATAAQSPVSGMSSTAVSAALSGLTPNSTYHYRVVATNAGGTTTGSDQTFTTLAAAPTATTGSAGPFPTGAELGGVVNANNSSTTVTFEYGLTTAYGSSAAAVESPVAGTSDTTVSVVLSGLVPNTPYHYRLVAANAGGTTNGLDQTFTTLAAAPTVTTGAASSVTTTSAAFNGTVNANNASTTVTFEYGPTSSYGSTVPAVESPVSGTSDTAVSAAISGLTPNSIYHFRVVATNPGGVTNGADQTFTTSTAAPAATTSAATAVTISSATLNGIVSAGNDSTTTTFEYGLTASYGSSVTAVESPVSGTSDTAVSAVLSGLTPNTTYHFRVVAVNSAGTTTGGDQTFTTLAAAPTAVTSAASALSLTGAALNGTVNANNASTTVTFEYGLTDAYGTTVSAVESPVSGLNDTAVSAGVTGLAPYTTYHFRVVATNAGGTTYGSDMTFTTQGYILFFPVLSTLP